MTDQKDNERNPETVGLSVNSPLRLNGPGRALEWRWHELMSINGFNRAPQRLESNQRNSPPASKVFFVNEVPFVLQ